jgi:dihydropteroate synthase
MFLVDPDAAKPLVMGILNVTPDSFSDGGRLTTKEQVVELAERMIADGADLLDIGGESTRPFSEAVPAEVELARVLPAISSIRKRSSIPISIDTTKADVAREALAAGANIINDISALRFNRGMVAVARENNCPVIIMHMQGNPKNMQVSPQYEDVVEETISFLRERIEWLRSQGVTAQIIIDPGIGFGKTVAHNLTLLKHLSELKELSCPILIGHSRKSFIGKLLDLPVDQRDEATAVLSAYCAYQGASILRVHDVRRTAQAVKLVEQLQLAS